MALRGRPSKNLEFIQEILGARFLLASELISEVMQAKAISRDAASRAVERARATKKVFSSSPVSLSEGKDYLHWLPVYNDGISYFPAIRERLGPRAAFDCVVQALIKAGGALPQDYLAKFTPAPVDPRFGIPTASKIFSDLQRLRLLKDERSNRYGRIISLSDDFREHLLSEGLPNAIPFESLFRSEGLLLKGIAQWLQYTSMVAWNSVEIRNSASGSPVLFNGFAFDLKAPTYVGPMTRQKQKLVPGFLVADVSITEFLEHEAKAFVRKLSSITRRKNAPPIMGICFAEGFQPTAFDLLKKAGALPIQLSRIGGQNLTELIKCVTRTFQAIQAQETYDFEKIFKAIEQLSTERTMNMAGSIFELMIGRFLEQQGHRVRFFDMKVRGKLHQGQTEAQREVDIVSEKGRLLQIAEVKGYHEFHPVELSEVKRFFEETAPIARQMLSVQHVHAITGYAFFTSSYFTKEALDYLELLKSRHESSKKLKITFMNGDELTKACNSEGLFEVPRLLKRYFSSQRKKVFNPITEEVDEVLPREHEDIKGTAPEPTEIETQLSAFLEFAPRASAKGIASDT